VHCHDVGLARSVPVTWRKFTKTLGVVGPAYETDAKSAKPGNNLFRNRPGYYGLGDSIDFLFVRFRIYKQVVGSNCQTWRSYTITHAWAHNDCPVYQRYRIVRSSRIEDVARR